MPRTPSPPPPHAPSRRDGVVALVLALLSFAGVVATNGGVGYTRDESFYFRFGRDYVRWLDRLERADSLDDTRDVLSRPSVVGTWIGNFEHPPLWKTLFGVAWQHLADKDRALTPGVVAERRETLEVRDLDTADGFDVGDTVTLLAPLEAGVARADAGRVLGHATVSARDRDAGTAALTVEDPAALSAVRVRCTPSALEGSLPVRWTPCQARAPGAASLGEAEAMRWVGAASGAAAVALTYLLGVLLFGRAAALFAALAFLVVPRHFFHAHLICFDMPIVAAQLFVLYAFWRSLDDRRWALGAGVAWAIALLTKHNAFFLPVPLLAFWLVSGRHLVGLRRVTPPRGACPARRRFARWRVHLPPLPLALLVMPVVAFPALFVLWPKLWFDPFRAVADYFVFHLDHDHYMQWYFGQPLEIPPFPMAFPFVLTAMTVPVAFLALFAVGLGALLRPDRGARALDALMSRRAPSHHERRTVFALLNGLTPILLIALPSTPIFGGVKHWMTGMPLLLMVAGHGFVVLARAGTAALAATPGPRRWATGALAAALLVGPAWQSVRAAPFGTGWWNTWVAGGVSGAADRQMMRLYWGYTTRPLLGWLNQVAPPNARVFFQNTTPDAFEMYRREGLLRHDLRYHHGPRGADVAFIEPQKAFAPLELEVQAAMRLAGPTKVWAVEGVPMMRAYVAPSRPKGRFTPRKAKPDVREEGAPQPPGAGRGDASSQRLSGSGDPARTSPSSSSSRKAGSSADTRTPSVVAPGGQGTESRQSL